MFGSKLKEIRKLKRIPQSELSKLSGVAQSHISNIEIGKCGVSIETAQRLADALNISIKRLL